MCQPSWWTGPLLSVLFAKILSTEVPVIPFLLPHSLRFKGRELWPRPDKCPCSRTWSRISCSVPLFWFQRSIHSCDLCLTNKNRDQSWARLPTGSILCSFPWSISAGDCKARPYAVTKIWKKLGCTFEGFHLCLGFLCWLNSHFVCFSMLASALLVPVYLSWGNWAPHCDSAIQPYC